MMILYSVTIYLSIEKDFLIVILVIEEGRRGLVGLFVMSKSHGAKGRGIESQSFYFFYSFVSSQSREEASS